MNKLTPLCHKNTSKLDLYNHSSFGTRARRWCIPRAPAKPHKCSSSLADTKALQTLGEATSKTHRLRWVHKVQAPRVIGELRPFLVWAGTESVLNSHQSYFFSMEEMSFNELHIVKFQWFYGISRERVKCSNLSCSRFSNLLKYKWKSYMLIVN